VLIETLLDDAARKGTEMALLFSQPGFDDDTTNDFERKASSLL